MGEEVGFVLYGERGLRALEVTMAQCVRPDDLRGADNELAVNRCSLLQVMAAFGSYLDVPASA
jgi:hypothetical protein